MYAYRLNVITLLWSSSGRDRGSSAFGRRHQPVKSAPPSMWSPYGLPSYHVVQDVPSLRVIGDGLWQRVKMRKENWRDG